MKRTTTGNYRDDRYYPRIVAAVEGLLREKNGFSAVDVLVRMQLIREQDFQRWRTGRVPYLEKVVSVSLSKASRILRVLRMHAHDLQLKRTTSSWHGKGGGKSVPLRCSKTGDRGVETAYADHFSIIGRPETFRAKHGLGEGASATAERAEPPRPEGFIGSRF